jgi:hypothetical protein
MNNAGFHTLLSKHWSLIRLAVLGFVLLLSASSGLTNAQTLPEAHGFRIGERLTYNVTIGRFSNAAYGELYTVSRGKLGDKDAIELRGKFRTLELASAALYMVDQSRTTFVSPSTGLPLYSTISQNAFGLPKETIQNFLITPTPHFDLLTMIHRLRQSGGAGSLTMQEGEKVYSVSFQSGVVERQRTDAGEYETTLVTIQSEYFAAQGISDVRVNLSTDEAKIPVLIRLRTPKGLLRAGLASVQNIQPDVIVAQPTPVPVRTPVPERTPKPLPTPAPYVDNLPLAPELAFELGEQLDYRIMAGAQQVATMRLSARERRQFNGLDSLVLEATFAESRTGSPFVTGDFIRAYVNPETLAPLQFEMRFAGPLRGFTSVAKFDNAGSLITFGANRAEAPVGTHNILSLLYAARTFKLKPSPDLNNPVNDTRVAVFWESKPHIFVLRPSPIEVLTIDGKQFAAQPVTVSTKNPALDQMNIRIWLGNDEARMPLRFSAGQYTAELIAASKVLPN